MAAPQRTVSPVIAPVSGRRVALLIGNKDYARRPLSNPVNDATDLAGALRALGFEVTLSTNLNRPGLDRAVREFAASVSPGDAALFFFSGHGMEVEGQNYLLPVDFDAQAEEEVKYQALPASLVQERLQGRGARVAILILDACRDNPYRSWRGSSGGGLAGMSGAGVYVAFAAAPGHTADDNPGQRNGLFTKHLLAAVREPGLSIDEVFNRVREGVASESGGKQVPFSNSGLIGRFAFREAAVAAPAAVAMDLDVERYQAVKDSRDAAQLEQVASEIQRADLALILRDRARALRSAGAPVETAARIDRPEAPASPPVKPLARAGTGGHRAGETKVNPKDGLTYVWIPPGKFMMGCSPGDSECNRDEIPARPVDMPSGFWLGQTPVTQQAYQRVTGQNPSHFKGAKLPVEMVDWDDAQNYCKAIGGELPSEAEWEYAARAGTTGARYGSLGDIAWYDGNSGSKTHEVGRKQANAFGLFDMLGNVRQWTADLYPQGYAIALRGGSLAYPQRITRVSFRLRIEPGYRNSDVGFRCVAE
jgi:formylglycine-generating enzyme required for sulfatase activity